MCRIPRWLAVSIAIAGCATITDEPSSVAEVSFTSADDIVGIWRIGGAYSGIPEKLRLNALQVDEKRGADGSHRFRAWVGRGNVQWLTDYSFALRGTVTASDGTVYFALDESDQDPELARLPTEVVYDSDLTKGHIFEAFAGGWNASQANSNELTLTRYRRLSGIATTASSSSGTHTLQMYKRASFCESAVDCEGQNLERSCPGVWTCETWNNFSCVVKCEERVAPGDVRIRVAPTVPANGITLLPIFLDGKNAAAIAANLEVTVAGANIRVGPAPFSGVGAMLDGWETPFEARWHLAACDRRTDASCDGPVRIRVHQVGETEILAEANVTLVAPSDDMPIAACLGLGNVAQFRAVTDDSYVTRTFGNLAWSASYWHALERHHLAFENEGPLNEFNPIETLEIKWAKPEPTSRIPFGGFDLQYGTRQLRYSDTMSRLRIDTLDIEPADSGNVRKAALSWDLEFVEKGKEKHLRGCFNYDEKAPTLNLSNR